MSKRYLIDIPGLEQAKEGDIIRFEMPSFTSGEYVEEIKSDHGELYVEKFWDYCRGYNLITKEMEHYQTFKALL